MVSACPECAYAPLDKSAKLIKVNNFLNIFISVISRINQSQPDFQEEDKSINLAEDMV